jgi:hypothetical protein
MSTPSSYIMMFMAPPEYHTSYLIGLLLCFILCEVYYNLCIDEYNNTTIHKLWVMKDILASPAIEVG